MRARSIAVLAALAAASVLVWWLGRPLREPWPPAAPRAEPSAGGAPSGAGTGGHPGIPARIEPEPGSATAEAPRQRPGGSHDSLAPPPEASLGMVSRVPHRMLRAWRAAPGAGGSGEFMLVVEPSLRTGELEQLLRDVLSQNSDAEVLTIRIYDSEEAATYNRHIDGGALAERHLVASATRHRKLGVESLRLRGVEIEP